jgi:hypothetical protein
MGRRSLAHGYSLDFTGRRIVYRRPVSNSRRIGAMISVKAKDLSIPFHAIDFDYEGKQGMSTTVAH